MGISKGLVEKFDRFFLTYFDSQLLKEFEDLIDFESRLDDKLGDLLYHFIMYFTFYHELGHLVKWAMEKNETDEKSEETDEKSEETDEKSKETDEKSKETDEKSEETDEKSEETDEKSEETDEKSEETDEKSEETDEKSEEIDEKLIHKKNKEAFYDHCLEIDADTFASNYLNSHMIQYLNNNYSEELNSKDANAFLSLVLSSIFVYCFTFNKYQNGIYYDENSHPHPVIRLFNVLGIILGHFSERMKQVNEKIEVDKKEVMENTFKMAEILVNHFYEENAYPDFKEKIEQEVKEIFAYLQTLKQTISKDEKFAINFENSNNLPTEK